MAWTSATYYVQNLYIHFSQTSMYNLQYGTKCDYIIYTAGSVRALLSMCTCATTRKFVHLQAAAVVSSQEPIKSTSSQPVKNTPAPGQRQPMRKFQETELTTNLVKMLKFPILKNIMMYSCSTPSRSVPNDMLLQADFPQTEPNCGSWPQGLTGW